MKYFNFTTLGLSFIVLVTRKSCASWVFDYTRLPWSVFTFFYLQPQKSGCSPTLQLSQIQTLDIDVTIQCEGCAFYRYRGLGLTQWLCNTVFQCHTVKEEPTDRQVHWLLQTMSLTQYASHRGQAGFSWSLILQWQSNQCVNNQFLSYSLVLGNRMVKC